VCNSITETDLQEWNGGRLPEILHADAEKFWRSGEDHVFAGIIPPSPGLLEILKYRRLEA
jgi:hypothetical protein